MSKPNILVVCLFLFLMMVTATFPAWGQVDQRISQSNLGSLTLVRTKQIANIIDFDFQNEQLIVLTGDHTSHMFSRFRVENGQFIYLFGREFRQSSEGIVALAPNLTTSNSMTVTTGDRYRMIRSSIDTGFAFEYPLEYFLQGHQSPITVIEYDTSNMIYSGDESGQIFMWEAPENPETTTPIDLYNTQSTVTIIDISPSGQIAIGNVDGTLHIGSQQEFDQVIAFDSSITTVAWHPDTSNMLAYVLSNQEISILSDGVITSLPIKDATTLAWSPDGTQLAVGQENGDILIWDVANQSEVKTLRKQATAIKKLVWNEDTLASGSSDGLYLWDVTQEEAMPVTIACCEVEIKTDHNSSEFVFLANNKIVKWNIITDAIEEISLPEDYVPSVVTISSSGRYVAFYDSSRSELILMENFNGTSEFALSTIDFGSFNIRHITFSQNETLLYITDQGNNLVLFSLETQEIVWSRTLRGDTRNLLQTTFAENHEIFSLSLTSDGNISLFGISDTETGESKGGWSLFDLYSQINVYKDTNLIIGHGGNRVAFWHIDEIQESIEGVNPFKIFCENDSASDVFATLLKSNDLLFCASENLEVWDVESNELVASFDLDLGNAEVTDIKLMNDDRSLFIVTTAEIQHWQIVE